MFVGAREIYIVMELIENGKELGDCIGEYGD
jgi:hypothetical protein